MKILYPALIIIFITACSVREPAIQQEQIMLTRKYAGNLLDYRRIEGGGLMDPDIIWLKTTLENVYGKIGIYVSGKFELDINERLYIRRVLTDNPGMNQWTYFLESDDGEIFYRLRSSRKGEEVILPKEMF